MKTNLFPVKLLLLLIGLSSVNNIYSQNKLIVIGSSTAAGLAASSPDSSWVGRINRYYKYQLGKLDSTYNLGVSGSNIYCGMPTTYIQPPSRPAPDVVHNISMAVSLLSGVALPTNGVVIINFPSGGYDTYSVNEIMSAFQIIYDSAIRLGNRCYVCTTQPRTDGGFAASVVKRKMADLKDSIINRFGSSNTINFWDGMYNIADTTILTAYTAGDNVHFNNAGHRELFNRIVAKNIFNLSVTSSAGDYRSSTTNGAWNNASSWEIYNGTSWVAASVPPTSADGIISIRNGHRIDMTQAVTFDQVIVDAGGSLYIYNFSTATTFTLNDGAGIDIEVNGNLYVSVNCTLSGTGAIENNYGGIFTLRNYGILSVNARNLGTMNVSGTGSVQNATVTNDNTFTLLDFTLNLNNATFINNDSMSLAYNANSWIGGTGSGVLTNNSGSVICKTNSSGIMYFTSAVALTNNGIIKGIGECQFLNTSSNNGYIAPGSSTGTQTVNPAMITGKSPVIDIEINSTGAVAGVNYDQLILSTIGSSNVNVTGATLQITDNSNDVPGTVYTIISSPSGTITGPFANVILPPLLGNIIYNSNSITVKKMGILALSWGDFTATLLNKEVALNWSTLQEVNTSHFIIEHSSDNISFSTIGEVRAKGSSTSISHYSFVQPAPTGKINYYRIKQVNVDGTFTYSATKSIKTDTGHSSILTNIPNPVRNEFSINSSYENLSVIITDMYGRTIRNILLQPGINNINCSRWSEGIYRLSVIEKGKQIEVKQLLKLR